MDVEPARVAAAGHLAAALIAQQHGAAPCWRDGLGGTRGYARAGRGMAGPGRWLRVHVGVMLARPCTVGSAFVLVSAVVGLEVVRGRRVPVYHGTNVLGVT